MVVVRVPSAVGKLAEAVPEHRHKLGTGLDEPAGCQTALAEERHAIALTQSERLSPDIQCLTGATGCYQREGHVLMTVERNGRALRIQLSPLAIKLFQQGPPPVQSGLRDVHGKLRQRRQ